MHAWAHNSLVPDTPVLDSYRRAPMRLPRKRWSDLRKLRPSVLFIQSNP